MKHLAFFIVLISGAISAYAAPLNPIKNSGVGTAITPTMDMHHDDFLLGRIPESRLVDSHHNVDIESVYLQGVNSYEEPETWREEKVSGENSVFIFEIDDSVKNSTKSIFDSLVAHVNALGAEQAIACSGVARECGFYFPRRLIPNQTRQSYYRAFHSFYTLNDGEFYFYSGRLNWEGEQYAIALTVSRYRQSNIQYALDILREEDHVIEPLVTASSTIKEAIDSEGKVVLGGLYFEMDKTELRQASNVALEEIATYLKHESTATFKVVGHTDSTGGDDYNLNLSQGRAREVVSRLVEDYAISADMLVAVGAGETQPVESNHSILGRSKNRRVELVLLSAEINENDSIIIDSPDEDYKGSDSGVGEFEVDTDFEDERNRMERTESEYPVDHSIDSSNDFDPIDNESNSVGSGFTDDGYTEDDVVYEADVYGEVDVENIGEEDSEES